MQYKKLVLLMLLAPLFMPLHATHYMGGEITWECTPQGNFRFTMIIYRECYTPSGGNAAIFPQSINMQSNVPGFATIQMNRVSLQDMSPVCGCPGGPNIYCPGMPGGAANMGAMQKNIYTSDTAYPSGVPLTGVPPATGWYFGYGGCCRNPCNNIHNSASLQFFLRAFMYPYQGTSVDICFDNSPKFLGSPSMVLCTGYPYKYNHAAFDDELDSLVYEWGQPLNNNIVTPITAFFPGYSFNSPLPDTIHNSNNVPATLNPNTGEISFTSYTNGAFVVVVKVTAYKCGIKVAEVFREIQIVLAVCGTNNPPNIYPPFQDSLGQFTLFRDTVLAGQSVNFSVSATDFGICPGSSPPTAVTLNLFAYGGQFGSPINPGGCTNPPCAVLTPSPTNTTPISGVYGVQSSFNWQTDCQHASPTSGCQSIFNTYNFLFKVSNSVCPIPITQFAVVTIVVVNTPSIPSPPLEGLEVLSNGDMRITWQVVQDQMNSFKSYYVWGAPGPAGPFVVLDSIFDINTVQWVHTGAGGDTLPFYYYITVQGTGCGGAESSHPIDTLRNIILQTTYPGHQSASFTLNWNHPHSSFSSLHGNHLYEVWRKLASGSWMMVDQTLDTLWHDFHPFCSDTVAYRIEFTNITNPAGFRVVSNTTAGFYENTSPPQPTAIQVVTTDNASNHSLLTWFKAVDADAVAYIVTTELDGSVFSTDTIWNINDTTWLDVVSNPCTGILGYQVSVMDFCKNVSLMSAQHQTMHLTAQFQPAQQSYLLNWNPYPAIVSDPGSSYTLWCRVDGGSPMYLALLPPQTTSYTHTNLMTGDTICYYVLASDPTLTLMSRSCEVCVNLVIGLTDIEPHSFYLGQNIPNPVTGQTLIPFIVPEAGLIEIYVTSLTGTRVWHEEMQASPGSQHFTLEASTLAPGVYLYSVKYRGAVQTRKMTVW